MVHSRIELLFSDPVNAIAAATSFSVVLLVVVPSTRHLCRRFLLPLLDTNPKLSPVLVVPLSIILQLEQLTLLLESSTMPEVTLPTVAVSCTCESVDDTKRMPTSPPLNAQVMMAHLVQVSNRIPSFTFERHTVSRAIITPALVACIPISDACICILLMVISEQPASISMPLAPVMGANTAIFDFNVGRSTVNDDAMGGSRDSIIIEIEADI